MVEGLFVCLVYEVQCMSAHAEQENLFYFVFASMNWPKKYWYGRKCLKFKYVDFKQTSKLATRSCVLSKQGVCCNRTCSCEIKAKIFMINTCYIMDLAQNIMERRMFKWSSKKYVENLPGFSSQLGL